MCCIVKEETINISWDLTVVNFECPTKEFGFSLPVYAIGGLGAGRECDDHSRKIGLATAHIMRVT